MYGLKREMIMITCKEDLLNTYILKSDKEALDLFLLKCVDLDVRWSDNTIATKYTPPSEALSVSRATREVELGHCDAKWYEDRNFKQLTLADFKPKVKVEYVKCEFKAGWEAVKAYEIDGDLLMLVLGNYYKAGLEQSFEDYGNLYRKVETELTLEGELNDFILANNHLTAKNLTAELVEAFNITSK
jgi:hypothetical protein